MTDVGAAIVELLDFVRLYQSTYSHTQKNPSPADEAKVIMKAAELHEKHGVLWQKLFSERE